MGEVIAFVHAKGHSERIPRKNLQILAGIPLIGWAIYNARACEDVTRVIIDSDSDEILETGAKFGAEPLKRPDRLASNDTTGDDLAYWQATNFPKSEVCVQVVPTSPFIRPETISKAVRAVWLGLNSAFSARSEPLYKWQGERPVYLTADGRIRNSQDLEPTVFETTGLYTVRTIWVLKHKRRLDPSSHLKVEVSPIEAVDINTMEDLYLAHIVAAGIKELRTHDYATRRIQRKAHRRDSGHSLQRSGSE